MSKEQKTIEGAVDEVTPSVRALAKKVAKATYEWKQLGKDLEVMKPALEEKMAEDDVQKLEVSFQKGDETIHYEVERDAEEVVKIKCKKIGKGE